MENLHNSLICSFDSFNIIAQKHYELYKKLHTEIKELVYTFWSDDFMITDDGIITPNGEFIHDTPSFKKFSVILDEELEEAYIAVLFEALAVESYLNTVGVEMHCGTFCQWPLPPYA